jgi:hypothetical protein
MLRITSSNMTAIAAIVSLVGVSSASHAQTATMINAPILQTSVSTDGLSINVTFANATTYSNLPAGNGSNGSTGYGRSRAYLYIKYGKLNGTVIPNVVDPIDVDSIFSTPLGSPLLPINIFANNRISAGSKTIILSKANLFQGLKDSYAAANGGAALPSGFYTVTFQTKGSSDYALVASPSAVQIANANKFNYIIYPIGSVQ